MANGSERDKDFRRINSINLGTPGHWWNDYSSQENSAQTQEIEPSKLNLNTAEDFLKFLNALNRGEQKSFVFLHKIPQERKDELKRIHAQFAGFFALLDQ